MAYFLHELTATDFFLAGSQLLFVIMGGSFERRIWLFFGLHNLIEWYICQQLKCYVTKIKVLFLSFFQILFSEKAIFILSQGGPLIPKSKVSFLKIMAIQQLEEVTSLFWMIFHLLSPLKQIL